MINMGKIDLLVIAKRYNWKVKTTVNVQQQLRITIKNMAGVDLYDNGIANYRISEEEKMKVF